ncbi:HAD family phosphatase [Catenovulum sp. 2E275]|uniref:HAD family hydrolase n=1 Tax=Catenovulum sp. 2E275 TaxID=2980497 RepID=UPI0021D085AB|nr:HAD family phosphatase [Catenovulum sp. 2E275]MCU4676312.1 HAD family phosphatase [Catenovulum sp. 2E275]
MLAGLLIDHDGTLVDSEPCQFKIWQKILTDFGIDYHFNDFIPRIGIPGNVTAGYLVGHYQLDISSAELAMIKEQATNDFLLNQSFPLMPGIAELLNWAKSKQLKLAIVSGAERASVLRSLALNEIDHMIDLVVAGDDVEHCKPAPDAYLSALEQLSLTPEQVVAIEDSASGIQSAKAAGLTCLAIKHSFTTPDKLTLADQSFSHHLNILRHLAQQF